MKKNCGFTLVELMVTMLIISILAVIAITGYSKYIQKSRRTDGLHTLLAISLAEEKYRMSNTSYGTLAQVWGGVTTSPLGYYTLSISNVSGTAYTITATGIGNQANDTDGSTACSPLVLAVSNGTTTQTPSACWPK